jgi:hypothetical protein
MEDRTDHMSVIVFIFIKFAIACFDLGELLKNIYERAHNTGEATTNYQNSKERLEILYVTSSILSRAFLAGILISSGTFIL